MNDTDYADLVGVDDLDYFGDSDYGLLNAALFVQDLGGNSIDLGQFRGWFWGHFSCRFWGRFLGRYSTMA